MAAYKMRRKRKISFVIAFSVIACICYFVIMWLQLNGNLDKAKEKLDAVQEQYAEQSESNEKLKKEIDSGISDEEKEKIARDEYGYVMPGERVYADGSAGE